MLPQIAYISERSDPAERRGVARRVIRLGLDVAETPGSESILIVDISQSGMRVQTSAKIEVGEELRIILPHVGPVYAEVVRQSGNYFGAQFATPISQAAVSAVELAAPFESDVDDDPDFSPGKGDVPLQDSRSEIAPVSGWIIQFVLLLAVLIVGSAVAAIGFLPIAGFGR